MIRLLSIAIDCFSTIVFILPAVIIFRYALLKQHDRNKTFMVFLFAFYSMAVFSAVGIPTAYTLKVDFHVNFIPLIDIFNNPPEYIKNTILNIILFMPLGFLLPVIWKEYRSGKKTVFTGLAMSVIIELLQIFTFRLTDVDDLITNTAGTFAGYYCAKIFLSKLPRKMPVNTAKPDARKNSAKMRIPMKYEPVIILAITFLIAFFLKPLVSGKIWDIVLSGSFWQNIK